VKADLPSKDVKTYPQDVQNLPSRGKVATPTTTHIKKERKPSKEKDIENIEKGTTQDSFATDSKASATESSSPSPNGKSSANPKDGTASERTPASDRVTNGDRAESHPGALEIEWQNIQDSEADSYDVWYSHASDVLGMDVEEAYYFCRDNNIKEVEGISVYNTLNGMATDSELELIKKVIQDKQPITA